ncbi:MAG: hypothetical protein HZA50_06190 [Planctomycetes bacterium]|nr:hypothetical protein [Planctomycetota bacterium]
MAIGMNWRTLIAAAIVAAGLHGLIGAGEAPAQSKQAASGKNGDVWQPLGLSGGGSMFCPAISPADPKLMLIHCDMSGAYISRDGGRNWTMIHADQLSGNTSCQPAFHPTDPQIVYSADGWSGQLKVSRDAGRTWQKIGDLKGRLTGQIAIDPARPQRMLAGVDDGACVSQDGGKTWGKCAGPEGKVIAFFFDRTSPVEKRICLAATEKGIWRSDDGGKTWASKCRGLPWREIRGFAGGARPPAENAAGADAKGLTILYCAIPCKVQEGKLAGGIFISKDCGETWTSGLGEGLNKETKAFDQWAMGDVVQYHQVLTTDADPLRVYAFNANTGIPPPHHTAIYRSDDAGATWKPTFNPDPRWPGCNLQPDYTTLGDGQFYQAVPYGAAICQTNPDIVMAVDSGNCFITNDGGKAWLTGHCKVANPEKIDPKARRNPLAEFLNTGLVVTTTWNYYIDPFDPARHYICYTDIGFARSENAGKTWLWWGPGERPQWRNTCYELAFDPQEKGKVWGAFSNVHDIPNDNIIQNRHNAKGPGGVCVSTDFAQSWQAGNQGLPVAPALSVVVDPASPKGKRTLYAAVFGHGVYKSADDGKTWTAKNSGLGSQTNMRATKVILHSDGTLWVLITALKSGKDFVKDGPGLYRSADGGETWQCATAGNPLYWPKDFSVNPQDGKTVLVGAADAGQDKQGGLYRTDDGGKTWKLLVRKGPQHFGGFFSPHNKGWIYMTLCENSPGPALWLSKDDGKTWLPFENLPFRNIQRVAFDPKDKSVIYLATFGASVLRGPAEPFYE